MKRAFVVALMVVLNIIFLNRTALCQSKTGKGASMWDLLIKNEVEAAISMLQAIYEKHQKGEMAIEQAKSLVRTCCENFATERMDIFGQIRTRVST